MQRAQRCQCPAGAGGDGATAGAAHEVPRAQAAGCRPGRLLQLLLPTVMWASEQVHHLSNERRGGPSALCSRPASRYYPDAAAVGTTSVPPPPHTHNTTQQPVQSADTPRAGRRASMPAVLFAAINGAATAAARTARGGRAADPHNGLVRRRRWLRRLAALALPQLAVGQHAPHHGQYGPRMRGRLAVQPWSVWRALLSPSPPVATALRPTAGRCTLTAARTFAAARSPPLLLLLLLRCPLHACQAGALGRGGGGGKGCCTHTQRPE